MVIVDAKDLILGRFAAIVAKRALLGETIEIINCEQAIITGNRKTILAKYQQKRARGIPSKGPFIPRKSDMLVRRTIRGMLPYKRPKGRDAFKRVMCHIGVPKQFEGKKTESFPEAHVSRLLFTKHIKLQDLSRSLGAKI